MNDTAAAHPRHAGVPHQGWTLAIASLGLFMVALDTLVVTTALPVLRVDLGASLSDLEWTVNVYNLAFACFLLTGAALGDRLGVYGSPHAFIERFQPALLVGAVLTAFGIVAALLAPGRPERDRAAVAAQPSLAFAPERR